MGEKARRPLRERPRPEKPRETGLEPSDREEEDSGPEAMAVLLKAKVFAEGTMRWDN